MAFQRSHRLNLLRLVVLLLVALAGIKFLFRDSFTLELHKHVSKDSGFWGDTGDIVQDIIPQSQVLEVPAAKIMALRQKQQVPRDVSATEMRLVHLDLKGAAPRVSYLEQFILKHEKYQHLREVERFPNSFNPHVPDTLALLKSILSQVIEKHRRSTWIHIGADEVFHLGEGIDSKNWMSHHKGDVGTMYLKHIKEVLGFLTAQYWGLRVLMWDDMLRKISVGALQESGIAKHVSPVVWFYAPDFEAEQIVPFLTKYVESGFEAVWFASAFKGTTGPAQAWTPLSYHLKNHLSWLKVMQAVPRLAPLRLQGVVLTGWQRYDHYSVLCELLPVSIPSLAICLQTLVNGGFTEDAKRKVLDVLGLESVQLEQSTCEGRGVFPGVEIYHMVEQVNGHLKESILKALEEESAIKGWFSPYHRKRQFGNPRNMESFGSKVLKLHEDWESFVRDLRAQLERIYFPDTVEEWMEENVNPYLDQLRDLVRDYRAIIRLNGRPKAT
ncbi:hexosaminidase D-like isoform X3 [Corvus kubaryi]|uniref:hexosaminidase D-like isoform X3 n=1 Tax=Corvus kubaryi TaxID=68294 RepID=UPI001C057D5A|nr:hexosaminidase D-like isoform X3 [Corvus kubaryi]